MSHSSALDMAVVTSTMFLIIDVTTCNINNMTTFAEVTVTTIEIHDDYLYRMYCNYLYNTHNNFLYHTCYNYLYHTCYDFLYHAYYNYLKQGGYDCPENSHRNRGKVPFWGSIEPLTINHVDYSKVVSVDCLLVSQYDRNF